MAKYTYLPTYLPKETTKENYKILLLIILQKKKYRECTKKPYNFLTIDNTLPASNQKSKFLEKISSILIKMTITNQINIFKKNMQIEAEYDLDRKTAKISALSSNNLDKYEYLTGEDLGLKPSTVEQAKFEYSPLGKISNKGLDKNDQKEGLFKRLRNIENAKKNQQQNNNIDKTTKCL